MDEFLNCPLCCERFDLLERRPKVLECGHTFCLHCLLANARRNGLFCPTDRKEFTESPDRLKDNYYLFPLLDTSVVSSSRRRFWCVDCSAEATSHCEEHHDICNINKVRSRQAQEAGQHLAQQLRREVAVLQDLSDQLQALQEAVVASIQVEASACSAARQRALDALASIPDAASQTPGPQQAVDDACRRINEAVTRSTERVPAFEQKSRLLSLARRLAVASERDPDALLAPADDRDAALVYLSFVLLGHRDLRLSAKTTTTATRPSRTISHIHAFPRGTPEDLTLLLPDKCLLQVFQGLRAGDLMTAGQVCRRWRRLGRSEVAWRHREVVAMTGPASRERALVRVLRVAPCLDRLNVVDISRSKASEHVALKAALLTAPCRVRALHVSYKHAVDRAWSLDILRRHVPHLEEAVISYVTRAALRAVEEANLKCLGLWCCDKDVSEKPYQFSLRPPSRSSLQFLSVYELPHDTVCSLLRAHRHTLQRLKLPAPAPASNSKAGPDPVLSLFETACELRALRELRLDRWRRVHVEERCARQLESLRRILPNVSVRCSLCPAKPSTLKAIHARRHTVHGDPASASSTSTSSSSSSSSSASTPVSLLVEVPVVRQSPV